MSITQQDRPALILIDIQRGFDDIAYWGGHRNNPDAEFIASKLLGHWRRNQFPIFHVQHCSTNPISPLAEGHIGNQFKEVVAPHKGEPVITKKVNSAFIGTDLKDRLEKANIKKVVMAGLTTDHCVSTTTRMAGNYGLDTYVISDATATFDKIGADGQKYSAEIIHETALASLHNEFATIVTAEELIHILG